ncbi:MAG: hypothetical protein HQM06_01430 [Magnetococcales bacterium]|nr:hypothetical protein [Magnetococcales bacterium]
MKTQPEAKLWLAVLSRAILDLDHPEEGARAGAWIRSNNEGPGSFLYVADVLNQEPRMLRQRILDWYKRKNQSWPCAA